MATIKKQYTLNPGGLISHADKVGDKAKVYRQGDTIWLTDVEAQGASFVGRLTLVSSEGKIVREQVGESAPTVPTTTAPTTPASTTAPVRDWESFVADATPESLIHYMQDATADEIRQLRDAEKGRGTKKRAKVINAANSAIRSLNMAKARAARDAKQAERAAMAEVGAGSGVGDDADVEDAQDAQDAQDTQE